MSQTRERALTHRDYIEALQAPNSADYDRISKIQQLREIEIDAKYHTTEAVDAAQKVQRAYRGHRARRQLLGLTLDPSSRWLELIKELRFRAATAPHYGASSPGLSGVKRPRGTSDVAKLNWQRVGEIAEHAAGGDSLVTDPVSNDYMNAQNCRSESPPPNTMLLDSRYFLEMVDEKHRYGANLQVYHEEWLSSKTNQNFFYWLDYGDGRNLNLPGCSRAKLDKESIRYLSREERMAYLVDVDDEGKLRWHKNGELITTSADLYKDSVMGVVSREDSNVPAYTDEELIQQRAADREAFDVLLRSRRGVESTGESDSDDLDTISSSAPSFQDPRKRKHHHVSPATILNHLLRASVKPGTWIYVADTVGRLYVGIKSSGAFQHASFLAGARISSAGSIGIEDGQLTFLSPLSGHYRPTTKSFTAFVKTLDDQGVDLAKIRVSHAFEILRGTEYYGKSKSVAKKVFGRGCKHRSRSSPLREANRGSENKLHDMPATSSTSSPSNI